jgi:hypothetical protein
MTPKLLLLLFSATAEFLVGIYVISSLLGRKGQQPIKWCDLLGHFFGSAVELGPLTRKGFLLAFAVPVAWLVIYYGFMAHIWFSLGRWPNFGEQLHGGLGFHEEVIRLGFINVWRSFAIAAGVFVVCPFLPRWRHISIYACFYVAAAIGATMGGLLLAPHDFLNWYLD